MLASTAAVVDDDDDDGDAGSGWGEDVNDERFPRCWSFVNPVVLDIFIICISCIDKQLAYKHISWLWIHWLTRVKLMSYSIQKQVGWLVGEINIPFQHKNTLHRGHGLGWRFGSAKWRMANDTVTSQPRCLFVQQWLKMGKIGEAHSSYYASAYNRVKTNQPPQDLFIRSMWYLV